MGDDVKKASIKQKAKSFLTKQGANTKLGRKAIMSVIGDDGGIIFRAVHGASKAFYGREQARAIKADLIKIIVKIGLMVSERKLTPDNAQCIVDPVDQLAFQATLDFQNPNVGADPTYLKSALDNVMHVLEPLVAQFMKPKNVEKMQNVVSLLLASDFLHFLLNDQNVCDERQALSETLKTIMWGVDVPLSMTVRTCQTQCCQVRAAVSRGTFVSSGLCELHHKEKFEDVIRNSRLPDFLNNDERICSYLVDYCTENGESMDIYAMQFLRMARDFDRHISSPGARMRAMNTLVRKFLTPDNATYIYPSDAARHVLLDKIDRIDDDEPKFPVALFAPIVEEMYARLSDMFSERFLFSDQFQRFRAAFSLCPGMLKTAEIQQQARRKTMTAYDELVQ